MTEALNLIEKAEKAHSDFIEIRLDCFEESRNLKDLKESTRIPLIATNKLVNEKGFFAGTEAERQQTLLNAAKLTVLNTLMLILQAQNVLKPYVNSENWEQNQLFHTTIMMAS